MTRDEVADLARRCYNLLNGVVNLKPIDYLEIVERSRYLYDEYLRPYNSIAARVEVTIGGTTILVFAVDRVLELLAQLPEHKQPSFVIHVVIHELSHSNQNVDYDRYATDHDYYLFMEKTNNIYVYRFIENYKEWLMEKLHLNHLYSIEQDSMEYTMEKLNLLRGEERQYRMCNPVYWSL